jgi:hypothetical protein
MEDFYKRVYQSIVDGLDELHKKYDAELEAKSNELEDMMQTETVSANQIRALRDYAECFGKSKMLLDIRCFVYQQLKKAQEGEI